jgi:two-component system NtrC family sensor kinase
MHRAKAGPASGGPLPFLGRVYQTVSRCLGWRLVGVLSASLIILLGASGWLALKLHRQHLYALLEENAIGIGETILSSAHSFMLKNDQGHLTEIFQNVGRRENVLGLRLLDAQGRVRYSSDPREVGETSDIEAPLCRGCHSGEEVRSPATLRDGLQLYSLPPGRSALGLGVPVLNAPECSNAACHVHPPERRVLGMLDLELSTLPLETAMDDARGQMIGFGLVNILIISTILGGLAWRVVHRPLMVLLEGTRHLGGGDLSYRIRNMPSGELGELGDSLNEMSSRLEAAQKELEKWNLKLETKVAEKTRELEQTRDQMVFTEKMASLGKLAAVVAHEINNPLAGVLVYTKLVRRRLGKFQGDGRGSQEGVQIKDLDEKLSSIETEVARCGDIVRNLLLFSRHREAERAPADLNSLVKRSLKLVQHQADLGGISTQIELDPELPQVTCEAPQIQQAVLAVIINALEAMPDGGLLSVSTRYDSDRDDVLIEVADTGVGIPEEIQDRVFEPFFSTKSETKGTGLGLSVMYGIIHRHEGRIDFQSTPGKGTTFRLRVPVHPRSLQSPDSEGTPGERRSTP